MNEPRHVIATNAGPCLMCEGSRNVGEPGYTYYGVPEPGSYEACPACMDEHAIPTGIRWVLTDAPAPPPGEPWILLADVEDILDSEIERTAERRNGLFFVGHKVHAFYGRIDALRWARDGLAALAKGGQP